MRIEANVNFISVVVCTPMCVHQIERRTHANVNYTVFNRLWNNYVWPQIPLELTHIRVLYMYFRRSALIWCTDYKME